MAGVGGQYPDEWVSRGAAAPERWVQGEPKSPARGQAAIRLMAQEGSMPDLRHRLGGMQREARSGPPLPRWRCTTTHILRPSTLVKPGAYYDQRFVLQTKRNIGGRSLLLHFRNHILLNESRSAIQDAPNANTAAIRPALEGLAPLTSS